MALTCKLLNIKVTLVRSKFRWPHQNILDTGEPFSLTRPVVKIIKYLSFSDVLKILECSAVLKLFFTLILPAPWDFFALSGLSFSLVPKYMEKDLHQILKTVLETCTNSIPNLIYNWSQEKLLKARASNVYQSKTHVVCYNFYKSVKTILLLLRQKI